MYVGKQLWELDGSHWVLVTSGLPVANGGTMAYDNVRKVLIVTGSKTTRLIGDVVQPSVRPIGVGCAGSAGVPLLTSEPPRLGSRHRLAVDRALPRALVMIALSGMQRTIPIGGRCNLYLGGSIFPLPATSNGYGHAEISTPIPLGPALRGLVFYAQAAVFDPKGAGGGFAVSGGLRLRIGDG